MYSKRVGTFREDGKRGTQSPLVEVLSPSIGIFLLTEAVFDFVDWLTALETFQRTVFLATSCG